MTIEEKAKAYDEAVGKAEDILHTSDIVEIIDIFPQLAESKDERIRKEMIDFLNQYKEDGLRGVDITPWITYLEKQKDHFRDSAEMVEPESMDGKVLLHTADKSYKIGYRDGKMDAQKEMEIDVKDYRLRDTWAYIDEFIKKFGRVPKDIDELSACVDYVIKHKTIDEVEQKSAENIPQLTVQNKGVYKICPRCKERMVRDNSKVYTSIPPQYGYECPKCGKMEFDTVMYDSPEMEKQKPVEIHIDNPNIQKVVPDIKISTSVSSASGDELLYVSNESYAIGYRDGKKEAEQKHVECIKFNNEFENQVSYLLASILNGEHEYSNGFIKYAAQSLLGQAKNELNLTKWNDVTINVEPIPTENQSVDISLANWSEEDKKALDMCYELLLKAEYTLIDKGYFGSVQFIKDWLKSLPERFVLQSKHEWSEEDERMLSRCMKSIETSKQFADSGTFKAAKDKEIAWLKSIHERFNFEPKQEWSEEDSIKIRTLSSIIYNYAFYKDALDENNDLTGEYAELDNWLGSLSERFILQPKKSIEFTEKQDYSSLNDLERAIHRGFLIVGVENVPVTIIKETAQDCLAQMKPIEWIEEDMWIMKAIENAIKVYGKTQSRYLAGYEMDTLIVHLKNAFTCLEYNKTLFHSGAGLYYYNDGKATYIGNPATADNPYDFAMSQQEDTDWVENRKKECLFRKQLDNGSYGCEKYAGIVGVCDGRCSWIVDCPTYLKYVTQKPAVKQLGGTFNSYDMAKTFTEGQYYVIEHPERFGLCKKPTEWDEEDEEKLEQCIKIVSGWEVDYDIVKSPYSNFLKSLRPSWKPGEDEKSKK